MTKILITGSGGFLGSHLLNHFPDAYTCPSRVYDLRTFSGIDALFKHIGIPDIIYHLAANVGGIDYNINNAATLFYDNVLMNTLLIHKAALSGVKKFVFVSSVCAYPKHGPVPWKEHNLWSGYPEDSNGTYGLSKRIVLPQLEAFYQQFGMQYEYPILSNIYGPGDDFTDKGHVIPMLIRKFMTFKDEVVVWGDGTPTRDFLYVEDAAKALAMLAEIDCQVPMNLASGKETSIKELVELLTELTEFSGKVTWDKQRPGGQKRRAFDLGIARKLLDWQAETSLRDGLKETIQWYCGPIL